MRELIENRTSLRALVVWGALVFCAGCPSGSGGGGVAADDGGTSLTKAADSGAPSAAIRAYKLIGAVDLPSVRYDLQFLNGDHIIQTEDGTLYAATLDSIVKADPSGAVTALFRFTYAAGEYGTSLMQADNGELYGTTYKGGKAGYGTIFRLTLSGEKTELYSFCNTFCNSGAGSDAALPTGMIRATDGNFYSTTAIGGSGGEVFKMDNIGAVSLLCKLKGRTDGSEPRALMQASDNNLYGVAWQGGANGAGTIFRVSLSGIVTPLYSFALDPATKTRPNPIALVEGDDHNLYGVTQAGGTSNQGMLFKLTLAGEFSVVRSFSEADHLFQPVTLVGGRDGKLYGIASTDNRIGAVFAADLDGTTTIIHTATTANEGFPTSLVAGADGKIYGSAYLFGPDGTSSQIFELD